MARLPERPDSDFLKKRVLWSLSLDRSEENMKSYPDVYIASKSRTMKIFPILALLWKLFTKKGRSGSLIWTVPQLSYASILLPARFLISQKISFVFLVLSLLSLNTTMSIWDLDWLNFYFLNNCHKNLNCVLKLVTMKFPSLFILHHFTWIVKMISFKINVDNLKIRVIFLVSK